MLRALSLSLMIGSSALLSGEASGQEVPAPASASPSEVEAAITLGRTMLDDQLVDYPNTRLRNVRALAEDRIYRQDEPPVRVIVFCGEINAPNRMGGMTGWTRFALNANTRTAFPLVTESRRSVNWTWCDGGTVIDDTDYSSALSYERR